MINIVGAGSLAKLVVNILKSNEREYEIEGLYDDNTRAEGIVCEREGKSDYIKVRGRVSDLPADNENTVVIAIGEVDVRRRLWNELYTDYKFEQPVIHRSSILSKLKSPTIQNGTIVKENAVLEPGCFIGANCVIGNNSTVCHDVKIGNHSRIAPGVTIAGGANIGPGVYLCPGVTVDKDISIAPDTTVVSGTSVYKDIKSPGRTIKPGDL